MKRAGKVIAYTLIICILLSANVFAEESVQNITCEKRIEEQNEKDMKPVCTAVEASDRLQEENSADDINKYEAFEGSFSSAEDSVTYNFSIDFSQMDSAAVCIVRKGYIGTNMKVYDENGTQILAKSTNNRQAKSWGYIDKPSENSTVCNYSIVVKPNSYEDRASDYRIIIGNKNETELMMSGIENTVLLEQYYESKMNLQNSTYVPNVGEFWYKYTKNLTSIITIVNQADDIRFKILDVDTLLEKYNSETDAFAHRKEYTGSFASVEKKELDVLEDGKEYYLVIYCTNPNKSLPIRTASMVTAVGNPIMHPGSVTITPGKSVLAPGSSFSAVSTFSILSDVPKTAKVDRVYLYGVQNSQIDRWRLTAPGQTGWTLNEASHSTILHFSYTHDSKNNISLIGNWKAAFKSSGSNYTFTPRYEIYYYYEYGD